MAHLKRVMKPTMWRAGDRWLVRYPFSTLRRGYFDVLYDTPIDCYRAIYWHYRNQLGIGRSP